MLSSKGYCQNNIPIVFYRQSDSHIKTEKTSANLHGISNFEYQLLNNYDYFIRIKFELICYCYVI